ncbi:hypothetical protein GOV14_03875 [Candidatus Pacearchaeota archaeon]|nr:hypothetical protein [Candidatus Pacearchaeota archaeon]
MSKSKRGYMKCNLIEKAAKTPIVYNSDISRLITFNVLSRYGTPMPASNGRPWLPESMSYCLISEYDIHTFKPEIYQGPTVEIDIGDYHVQGISAGIRFFRSTIRAWYNIPKQSLVS